VAETTSRRTQALLTKKGIGPSDNGEGDDPLMRDTPCLAGLYAYGVRGRIATGPNAGKRIRTWGGAENLKSENHPHGVAPTSMGSVSSKCELAGPSASKAGKFMPLYVETSTGCRALGASCIRPPRVSDENALAQRHDARDHERW